MELTVLHLLLILVVVVVLGFFGYKAYEGFDDYLNSLGAARGYDWASSTATKPICPAGKFYNQNLSKCTSPDGSIPVSATCPSGSILDITKNVCIQGSPSSSTTSTVSTASGIAKSGATDACGNHVDACGNSVSLTSLLGLSGVQSSGTTTLSSGDVINNVPVCPDGQTFDSIQGLCIGISNPACPTGQTYDQTKGACVSNTIIPLTATQSLAAQKAADSSLLQNIQQIVHNELLSQNGMATGTPSAYTGQSSSNSSNSNSSNSNNSNNTTLNSPSNYQGIEYSRSCGKTGAPDMSQYIRKDSIPCWGCSIP
jgi:hypothetical protein